MANNMEPGMQKPWPGKPGMIPVTDGSTTDSNVIARHYNDSIQVEMRILDTVEADTTFELWGKTFASPIMTPAFSHLNKVTEDGSTPMMEYAKSAKKLNLVNWVGMEPDDEFAKIMEVGADTIRIIKPFMDHEEIMRQIRCAEETGAFAVGIDIDHSIGTDGKYDIVDGLQLGPITTEDLKKFVNSTKLPFIAKGVLSLRDAKKCVEAGVKGIVVSHHHGRMACAVAPLQVLQEIVPVLAGSGVKIFVDCHMDTGYDAYKALALGADAVCVGRPILAPLLTEGEAGCTKVITKNMQQLREMMGYTGVKDLHCFDPSVLVLDGKHFG